MYFTMRPALLRLRHLLLGGVTLRHRAVDKMELSPAVRLRMPAALALPGELSRVRQVSPNTKLLFELARIRGGMRRHEPTQVFCVENVRLLNGVLMDGKAWERIQPRHRSALISSEPPERRVVAQLATSYAAEKYFAHWLFDAMGLELLAEKMDWPALAPTVLTPRQHEQDYRERLRLLPCHHQHVLVERLWIADDLGMNPHRTARLCALRDRLRRAADAKGRGASERVFLLRGGSGARRLLVNEMALAERLSGEGFRVINPMSASVAELAEVLTAARLVVGVEGSGFAHALAHMPAGSAILTLQPPCRFDNCLKDYADALGVRYAFVVGDERGKDEFSINEDRLRKTIDLVLKRSYPEVPSAASVG